ncbi:hypothetical protein TD95_000971 [Thielaviopsis punctulata]|uniref:Leucine-rich repeat-containing protein n=1 Tax=Thielaviopsis punctulata TaxID=72032 RepID=A0A0F4ZC59_9PEZI|nr:hypothetical protein TD95_000971 [Thielaviopsis punctulata]
MDSEDGEVYIKNLANYVHNNEKALANGGTVRRNTISRHAPSHSMSSAASIQRSPTLPARPSTSAASSPFSPSFLTLGFGSQSSKATKLSLTPHHLFYLLSRFEELGIDVGPMKVRLESIQDANNSSNYVSFLSNSQRSKTRGSDVGSIRSVSSIRSVVSSVTSMWSNLGFGANISAARTERHKALIQSELKYLYSSFTKIPALRLSPDWRARLVHGYEEFPFDSAVPLHAFKNVQTLEVEDIDFRQFFGWDRMADQLRSLSLRRACIEDPADILIDIVLDDIDKRRRRTSKHQQTPPGGMWPGNASPRRSPTLGNSDLMRLSSPPGSPDPRRSGNDLRIGSLSMHESVFDAPLSATLDQRSRRLRGASMSHYDDDGHSPTRLHHPSASVRRSRHEREGSISHANHARGALKVERSGSGSSHSSLSDSLHTQPTIRPSGHQRRGSSSNLLNMSSSSTSSILPITKWRFLRHLSLADNLITAIPNSSLAPLANNLYSLDLSSNLFTQVPDSLATLTALRALNLAHCMIDSLHSLTRDPLPAISSLNLRANRLESLSGIERLLPLERLDLRENHLKDPVELARLTGMPYIREIWVDGNPFTRTHKDYRITIFNLFRKTPGYTEDLVIDGSGPSYSEKRYLVDRVPVPAAVPVVRQPAPEVNAVDIGIGSTTPTNKSSMAYHHHYNNNNNNGSNNSNSNSSSNNNYHQPSSSSRGQRNSIALSRNERPIPLAVNSEASHSTSRRRMTPKKRIVDLSTSEPSRLPQTSIMTSNMVPPPIPTEHFGAGGQKNPKVPPSAKQNQKPSMTINTQVSNGMSGQNEEVKTPTASYGNLVRHRMSQSSDASPPEPTSPPLEAQAKTPKVVASDASSSTLPSESELSPIYSPGDTESCEWDMGGEMYRRKIEALRTRAGEEYLTILGGNDWRASPVEFLSNFSPATTASVTSSLHHSRGHAAQTQSAVVSGRTIG